MYDWNDEADAERFVRTYADLILRLCLSHGLSRADAQDICQELFLKLLAAQRTFTSEEHEKAWVIRAAGNACKNLLRAPYHSRRALLEQAHTAIRRRGRWRFPARRFMRAACRSRTANACFSVSVNIMGFSLI